MQTEYRQDGRLAILQPSGALTAAVAERVRHEWLGWIQEADEVQTVILDMRRIGFVDSSGLGLLIAILKRLSQRGGDLKIAGLQDGVRVVFEITRTYKVFEIFDNVDEAIRAMA